jgi:hypothetical protein
MRVSPGSREERNVQNIAFGILVAVLIFLFTFTFAVLGKGEYEPSPEEEGGHAETAIVLIATP